MIRKHKIGKREKTALETELSVLSMELEKLNQRDDEGFQLFYCDVKTNSKKVQRKFWLEEVLSRGFYHKEKRPSCFREGVIV